MFRMRLVIVLYIAFGLNISAKEELVLSHFLPTTQPIHHNFLVPWAKKVESCTGDKVNIKIFSAGSKYGNVHNQLNQVRNGTVDISHGLTGLSRHSLPRTMMRSSKY